MDEAKKQLIDFVKSQILLGVTELDIISAIKSQGWSDEDGKEVIEIAKSQSVIKSNSGISEFKKLPFYQRFGLSCCGAIIISTMYSYIVRITTYDSLDDVSVFNWLGASLFFGKSFLALLSSAIILYICSFFVRPNMNELGRAAHLVIKSLALVGLILWVLIIVLVIGTAILIGYALGGLN